MDGSQIPPAVTARPVVPRVEPGRLKRWWGTLFTALTVWPFWVGVGIALAVRRARNGESKRHPYAEDDALDVWGIYSMVLIWGAIIAGACYFAFVATAGAVR